MNISEIIIRIINTLVIQIILFCKYLRDYNHYKWRITHKIELRSKYMMC